MKHFCKLILLVAIIIGGNSCASDKNVSDAYGNFEALETFVSAEATGKILEFSIVEGQELKVGEIIGQIDTTQLCLNLDQLMAKRDAVAANIASVRAQINLQEIGRAHV